jgi:hypothetical protein
MKKPHKKRGTVRTDLVARKKPTVAKKVSPEFRSKRVKPTVKERIMAKAKTEYDAEPETETAAVPEPAAVTPAEQLLADLQLFATHCSLPRDILTLAKEVAGVA